MNKNVNVNMNVNKKANSLQQIGMAGAVALAILSEAEESGSAGPTSNLGESGSEGPRDSSADHEVDTNAAGIELVEREDLAGYLVARRPLSDHSTTTSTNSAQSGGSAHRGGTRFRWRPLQQFYTWVGRMKPEEVPAGERATVKAQVAEIKAKLEQLERALDDTETASGS